MLVGSVAFRCLRPEVQGAAYGGSWKSLVVTVLEQGQSRTGAGGAQGAPRQVPQGCHIQRAGCALPFRICRLSGLGYHPTASSLAILPCIDMLL